MTKDNRGGARPGSGRKPGLIKRKPYSFRLSPQEHKQVKSFITKLKEEINMTTSYKAIEDNGGGLHLVVFEDKKVVYMHSGYEYNKGQLTEDIKEILSGNSTVDDWEGNEDDPQASYDSIISFEYGWEVVADQDGVYPDKMGGAAQLEFLHSVEYIGGESRTNPGQAVDYMLATVGDVELYAELPALDDDEDGNFDKLKQSIINQAKLQGINPDILSFEQ